MRKHVNPAVSAALLDLALLASYSGEAGIIIK